MNLNGLNQLFTGKVLLTLMLAPIISIISDTGNVQGSTTSHVRINEYVTSGDTIPDSAPQKKESVELLLPMSENESITAQVAYMKNCHACHGVDRMGASAPSLYNLNDRLNFSDFKIIVSSGRSFMPGFRLLDNKTIIALYKYLSTFPASKQ